MKNKYKLITYIYCLLFAALAQSAVVTGFTYQGELTDNNTQANGQYDIMLNAFTLASGGSGFIFPPEFSNVTVTNGLFSLNNVDFGDFLYLNNDDVWLEISIRKTSVGGAYTILSPRQKIDASPYSVRSDYADTAGIATTATTPSN